MRIRDIFILTFSYIRIIMTIYLITVHENWGPLLIYMKKMVCEQGFVDVLTDITDLVRSQDH